MYTLSGVAAHDPDRWLLTDSTLWAAGTTITRPEATIPGFDGGFEMDGVEQVPALNLTWLVRRSNLDALRTLIYTPDLRLGWVGQGRAARVEVQALSEPTRLGIGDDPEFEIAATLVIPGVWSRGGTVTETTAIDADTKQIPVLAGMTGKVSDGVVVLTGPLAAGVRVQDRGGMSWFKYAAAIPAGSWLRFSMTTGRAWLGTAEDPWTGGTEVSSDIQTGPGPYMLRVTPRWTTDPATTVPQLTVTSTGRGAASALTLRAAPAYLI